MSVFSAENLIQNLNHDDRIVRSVALDLLANRGERSLFFTEATLDTFEARGLKNAFLLESNRFESRHDEETCERLLRFLETISPEQSAFEIKRMDSLLGWLLEAPPATVIAAEDRLQKITSHAPELGVSLSILLERMRNRETCASLPAETLRPMLEELLEDAADTMARHFPDREVVIIHDLCPFLLDKGAVSPKERQAWMEYEFDPEVMDYKNEFRLSTAFELAIVAEEAPDFDLLVRNFELDWDWIIDLVREIFCRVSSPEPISKLFDLYVHANEKMRLRLGDTFDNLSAPEYAAEIVATLGKEPSEELLLFHARTLASTGSEEGVAKAYQLVINKGETLEAVEALQVLYTWHILAEKTVPEMNEWQEILQADAETQEEMQAVVDEEESLVALKNPQLTSPLSQHGEAPLDLSYDPDLPQPEWNQLTGEEKELLAINHVEAREPHVGSRSEHARFHVIVEDQIAMGEETPAAATLDRLMGEGLSRHESIHAIASIIMEEVLASMNEGIKRTEEDYFESLGNLTAARWFADHGQDADAGSFATPAAILQKSAAKVSHNDPCPCGSGKKYERCCLKFAN